MIDVMKILPKLKRLFMEPQVYALVLESRKGSLLHLGVHYSLDEAVAAATPGLVKLTGDPESVDMRVDMWTKLKPETVLKALLTPEAMSQTSVDSGADKPVTPAINAPRTLDETVQRFRESKNTLMRSLIERGDSRAVAAMKDVLSEPERKLIMEKIQNRPLKKTHEK